MKVWHIDSSGRKAGSHSRRLTQQFLNRLADKKTIDITTSDVAEGLPFLNEEMIGSYFTPDEQRSDAQRTAIAVSTDIVALAKQSDIWVIGVPVYNFSMPAAFKAFIDLLCRAKETFSYGENGPVGLLNDKQVFVVVVSGGTEMGGDHDFLTPWLVHCLNFIGIHNVQFIDATQYSPEKEPLLTETIDAMTTTLSR